MPVAIDGQAYVIDLSGGQATELRQALRGYTTVARRIGAASRSSAKPAA